MGNLINVREYIEQQGFQKEEKFVKLSGSQIPGVVLIEGEAFLTPYVPEVNSLFHSGFFVGFNPDFDNLKNLRKGYFGNSTGYTYLSSDTKIRTPIDSVDIYLKIDYSKLGQQLYRDPEMFLERYHHEWDRSFMMDGAIPKSAIVEISFPEHIRLIQELRRDGDTLLNLDEYFERIKLLRKEFQALF